MGNGGPSLRGCLTHELQGKRKLVGRAKGVEKSSRWRMARSRP